jgi:hypothetical protein
MGALPFRRANVGRIESLDQFLQFRVEEVGVLTQDSAELASTEHWRGKCLLKSSQPAKDE